MTESQTNLGSADIARLLELLPHRYPFLLVDRIIDIDGDDSAIGIKNVTFNEPHFQGHFPGKPVEPGDVLEYHVKKIRNRGNLWRFQSEAKVGGVKVAEAEISAMLMGQ